MMHRTNRSALVAATLALAALLLLACRPVAPAPPGAELAGARSLVIYSGRNQNLVAPLIARFEAATGIDAEVRYGNTAQLAATILEEGSNSPADVFFSQDAGALGALAAEDRLVPLPQDVLGMVAEQYRSADGTWVGVSGRARVLLYNTDHVTEEELPADVYGLTDAKWRGRVGWAPTNAPFQTFVTALRVLDGDARARAWLEAMIANDVQTYSDNDAVVAAVGAGEVDVAMVNHYYLYQFLEEQGDAFHAANYYFPTPGAGSMMNVGGAGILDSAPHPRAAEAFVRYLLTPEAQEFFATETDEYPLVAGIPTDPRFKPLDELPLPPLDLDDLSDLEGTLQMLQEVGALQ